jgi:GDP-L-fucose synthase
MNWKDKRILITGGDGMIGLELCEQLIDLGANITIADIKNGTDEDLTNYDNCKRLCSEIDYVFHLAGIKGNPKRSKERPVDFMGPMLRFNTNMILAANEMNVKRFLYTSSIAVEFPEFDFYPAWAKLTGEKLIEGMRIQYEDGTKYVIVRPANVYGRYDDFTNWQERAMVVTSLIAKALESPVLEIWGDGSTIRDFINAKDVAKGMIKAMEEMPDFPVRLCSGEDITIKQLAEIISKYTEKEIKYIPLTNQVLGDKRRVMERNWDNPITINLDEGIKEVIDFVRDSK